MAARFEFTGEVWEWGARASWFFVTLPVDAADEIRARFGAHAAGFGSLKVEVEIGASRWQTSIFPDTNSDSYVLPLKKAVRVKEHLDAGDRASVGIRLLV